MDGAVPDVLDYESWLKTKPEAFQLEVLGPAKHALWTRGELSFNDLVDQSGNPRTVADLVGGKTVIQNIENIIEQDFQKQFGIMFTAESGVNKEEYLSMCSDVLSDILRKIPDVNLRPNIKAIHIEKDQLIITEKGRAGGEYSLGKETIRLGNLASLDIPDKIHKIADGKMTVSAGNIKGILRHEVGHAAYMNADLEAIEKGVQRWHELYGSQSKMFIDLTISNYATANAQEGFAEAFSIYFHPTYKPNDLNEVFRKWFEVMYPR